MKYFITLFLSVLLIGLYTLYFSFEKEQTPPPQITVEKTWEHTAEFSAYSLSEEDGEARITCYNDQGTMANGEQTFIGAVATSDRSIPMNTLIFIEGYGVMKISDKTALWVHEERGLTFDIYDPNCSKDFGVKKLKYKIL